MSAQIFSFVKVTENSMIASVRIARYISEQLGIECCWDKSIAEKKADTLIIINGAYSFAGKELLEALGTAIVDADKVVWVQNDYTIIPPKDVSGAESPFRKAFRIRHDQKKHRVIYWTTVNYMSHPGLSSSGHLVGEGSRYVNWNCLTMVDWPVKRISERAFNESLIYYGAFRKDRAKYFDRYFKTPTVRTMISCPNRKFEFYRHQNIAHTGKVEDLYGYIGEFGAGLYLEDKRSHNEFHSPANRFYEMLSVGLPILFQQESMRMMERAGYQVVEWTVWDVDDIAKSFTKLDAIRIAQRDEWYSYAMEERQSLDSILHDAWKGIQ